MTIRSVQQASIILLARPALNQPALLLEDRTVVLVLLPQAELAELAETSVQLTISNRGMALAVHSARVSKVYLQVTLPLRAIAMERHRELLRRGMPVSPLPMPTAAMVE